MTTYRERCQRDPVVREIATDHLVATRAARVNVMLSSEPHRRIDRLRSAADEECARQAVGHPSIEQGSGTVAVSPWLTIREAAGRAKCGERSIYNATRSGKLRAARLGGRRELRFLPEWVDAWLIETSTPVVVNATAPGGVNNH